MDGQRVSIFIYALVPIPEGARLMGAGGTPRAASFRQYNSTANLGSSGARRTF